MTIRNAQASDLDKLIWESELEKYKSVIEKELKESLSGKSLYFIAEVDGKLVGQIISSLPKDTSRPYMSALRIIEPYRNQGIGTKLIQHAEQELRKRGYMKIFISVALDNLNAKRLYEHLGYKVIHQRIDRWKYSEDGNERIFQEEVFDLEKDI